MDPTPPTLLLVDDEEAILASLKRLLRRDGYTLHTATSGEQGLEMLARTRVDVIVSDQRMPGMTGVDFLGQAKVLYPATVRMVLSGYTELQSVTDAINQGAIYKFLTKPWDDDHLRANIAEAFRHKAMGDENQRLHHELERTHQELLQAHQQLHRLLQDQHRRLAQDQVVMEVAHEVLDVLPMAVLGVDAEGMVVITNAKAQHSFPQAQPGTDLAEVPALAALTQAVPGKTLALHLNQRLWTVHCAAMGRHSDSQGSVLTLWPGAEDHP